MRFLLWASFFLFVAVALLTSWDEKLLQVNSAIDMSRLALTAIWISFVAYSYYCSRKENFFRTVSEMSKRHWGRQIGLDLYISVGLSIALVYLVTGSIVETLLWSLAFIPFANMAILLFIILHLDEIIISLSTVNGGV